MSEFVDCRTCKTDCVRADGNYGYTFCDKYTHPPMTNADRIRAMSDEELGILICKHALSCGCCVGVELCNSDDGIANGAVKWLQQPAEEDDHG